VVIGFAGAFAGALLAALAVDDADFEEAAMM
jgi:hypothetical protein